MPHFSYKYKSDFERDNELVEIIDLIDDEQDEEKIIRYVEFYNHKEFFKSYRECEKDRIKL